MFKGDIMQRFHPHCAVTNMPLFSGAKVVAFPMKKTPKGAYYNHDWYPASLPLIGSYNGDGAIAVDEDTPQTDIDILERVHGPLDDPSCLDAMSVSLFDLMVIHKPAWSAIQMFGCPQIRRRNLDQKREGLFAKRLSHIASGTGFDDSDALNLRDSWIEAHLGLAFEMTPWRDLIWSDDDLALRFRDTIGRLSTATSTYGFRMLPALELAQFHEGQSWDQMILAMTSINAAAARTRS